MENENARVTDYTVFYGAAEESIVKYLENHLKCLEEEYKIKIFLEDKVDVAEGMERRLCINYDGLTQEERKEVNQTMESLIPALLSYGQQQYITEQLLARKNMGLKEDSLTGLFSKEYLIDRADVLKRAEIYPTAVIAVKLRGWKSVTEGYGKESGDSLVQLATSILTKAADMDYLIGRMEEDVFVILIPLMQKGEVEEYCKKVQEDCQVYADSLFALDMDIEISVANAMNEDINEKIEEAMKKIA